MGKLYEKVADSRKWQVDAIAVFVILCGLIGVAAWMFSPAR